MFQTLLKNEKGLYLNFLYLLCFYLFRSVASIFFIDWIKGKYSKKLNLFVQYW